jgi:large-conductance mechanosensitive channel
LALKSRTRLRSVTRAKEIGSLKINIMSDLKEKILNGFMNVLYFGLPIALVLIFGAKFSLWLNLLTLTCVMFLSAVISMIGDEYESPKRILLALIGASIAANLKVLDYPGHTAVIILATILILCTYDLINRGQIIWLDFTRRSRLHFLEKFILLITVLGIVALVIANFGSQAIWIPIVTASLLMVLLLTHDAFLDNDSSEREKTLYISVGALILTGAISTIIQFWKTELFWGIKFWQLFIGLAILFVIIATLVFIWIMKQNRIERLENQEREKAEQEKRVQTETETQEKRNQALAEKQALIDAIMAKNPNEWTIKDFALIYGVSQPVATTAFLKSDMEAKKIADLAIVCSQKKQIVWDSDLTMFLQILEAIANKSFCDNELSKVINITGFIKESIVSRKGLGDGTSYKGEAELLGMIDKIEKATSTNN